MRKLLGTNSKLLKENGERYLIQGLTLAPHTLGGFETVCSESTSSCRSNCVLWFTGRTVTLSVRNAAIERTRLYFEDREAFEAKLCEEIAAHAAKAKQMRLRPVLRLNVASDLDWSHIAEKFPGIRFYDYTKVRSRVNRYLAGDWPSNYALTYSYTGNPGSRDQLTTTLENGGNSAVVFSTRYYPQRKILGKLPGDWNGFQVVDGDRFDVRLPEIDGQGVIVGLRFKGSLKRRANAIRQGFCVDVGSGL